jgi:hypothetical protein
MFTLWEINQMEHEMCNYLDWELTVNNPIFGQQHQTTPTKPYPAQLGRFSCFCHSKPLSHRPVCAIHSYYQILVAFPASQDRVWYRHNIKF